MPALAGRSGRRGAYRSAAEFITPAASREILILTNSSPILLPLPHMKSIGHSNLKSLLVGTLLCLLAAPAHAWEPNAKELDSAIQTGDFAGYLKQADAWLNQLGKPVEAPLMALLKDPAFVNALDQRQLIAKTGAEQLGALAKAAPANQAFLGWLLNNTQAMDLYLEGAVPIGLAAMEDNSYMLTVAALEIWNKILSGDPDA
jgi:hypothetical protein